ncbi:hypothetical protein LT722_20400 [Pseudomonas syringae pv. syringae]|uniref:hypothetical protein n=1 Tax=Pseudomonas syringae TaxID=317 RepID=UPI00200A7B52|nr:hypothetical protein [Pseudomonas syringae]MCK9715008.1 hypothetical protein [Pseudomonas syringae pv. syringae]MCK9763997.1 hypothetical protein [Pseudomonas syringae pv. syringae]MEE4734567.1 hypothetical protein [Pseudomonas alliivorans]
MLKQICQPLSYLAIQHPQKWKIDWLFPALAAVICVYFSADEAWQTAAYRTGGPISMLLGFFQCLPGFYIAALAAIATFGRTDIDDILPEPAPTVKLTTRGENILIKLTRRRFLAMLFSFLTCESIVLVLYSVFFLSCGGEISDIRHFGDVALLGLTFIFYTLLFQMVAATFWGLFYLGFKLHES